MAVWDGGLEVRESEVRKSEKKAKRVVIATPREGWDGGILAALVAFGGRVVRRVPPMEQVVLLILFLGMAWFAIYVALRIMAELPFF